jgi:hypothetical protein
MLRHVKTYLLTFDLELRNKVYEYCIEPEPIFVSYHPQSSTQQAGSLRSLTQVCRQIRTEFRPLYMEQTSFRFRSPQYCAEYIDAFYPVSESWFSDQWKGNITVLVPAHTFGNRVYLDNIGVVMHFAAMSPAVRIRFEHDEAAEHHSATLIVQLNDLIDCAQGENNPEWCDLVTSTLTGVIFALKGAEDRPWSLFHFIMDQEHDAMRWERHILRWWGAMVVSYGASSKLRVSWGRVSSGFNNEGDEDFNATEDCIRKGGSRAWRFGHTD